MATIKGTVNSCKGLKHDNLFGGKADPYVEIKVGTNEFKTAAKKNDCDPTWDGEHFSFANVDMADIIDICVMDKDLGKDDRIGHCTLPLSLVTTEEATTYTFSLGQHKKHKSLGTINLTLQATPPPGMFA
eukprot:NODE_955_length_645_cov_887.244966_g884_i0.p1 GENE.NODE_955_length_645_cov_887.244966_g884_i0~~NODE_955_length_645_cov_887.244966_g884_i0.p1  ORF type:complete len:130 (-),score=31.97 NODE_955_length_645_cov_887.244966_g884_i0:180-569(-)